MTKLEEVGISNASISKTEYSDLEQLLIELKVKAIKKAKATATKIVEPISQKVGKAIYISDAASTVEALQGRVAGVQIRGLSSIYGSRASEPVLVDFQKLTYSSKLTVRFIID